MRGREERMYNYYSVDDYPEGTDLNKIIEEDIEDLQELLLQKKEDIKTELPEKKIEFKILLLFGSLPSDQQMKIFQPIKDKNGKHIRKIILSTNVAETSLAPAVTTTV